jgi:hypothetical protein
MLVSVRMLGVARPAATSAWKLARLNRELTGGSEVGSFE